MKGNVSLSRIHSAPGQGPGAEHAPRRVLAVLLALALCFGMALPAFAAVEETGGPYSIELTGFEEISEASKPYSKGETITYRVTLTNNGDDIPQTSAGKMLKVRLVGSGYSFTDNISVGPASAGTQAPVSRYPSSSGDANEFRIQGKKDDVLWAKGAALTFYITRTCDGTETGGLREQIIVSAPDSKHEIWTGTVANAAGDFTGSADVVTNVTLTYHSNYPAAAGLTEKTTARDSTSTNGKHALFTVLPWSETGFDTPASYRFVGWSTEKDSANADYAEGAELTTPDDADLYAVWQSTAAAPATGTAVKVVYHNGPSVTYEDSYELQVDETSHSFTIKTRSAILDAVTNDSEWQRSGCRLVGWSLEEKTEPTYADVRYFNYDGNKSEDGAPEQLCLQDKDGNYIPATVNVTGTLDLYAVWIQDHTGLFGYTMNIPDGDFDFSEFTAANSEYGVPVFYHGATGDAAGAKKYYFPNHLFAENAEVTVKIPDPKTTRPNTVFVGWFDKTKQNGSTFLIPRGDEKSSETTLNFKETSTIRSLDAVWATMTLPSASYVYDGTPHGLNADNSASLRILNLGGDSTMLNSVRNESFQGEAEMVFTLTVTKNGQPIGDPTDYETAKSTVVDPDNNAVNDCLYSIGGSSGKAGLPVQTDAGSYVYSIEVKLKHKDDTVYTLGTVSSVLTILPRPVTVTGTHTVTYDGTAQTANFNEGQSDVTIQRQSGNEGLISTDTLGLTAHITEKDAGIYTVTAVDGEYNTSDNLTDDAYGITWADNSNYIVYPNFTFIIDPRPVTVTGRAEAEYDGTEKTASFTAPVTAGSPVTAGNVTITACTFDGLVAGDTLGDVGTSFSVSLAATNEGTYTAAGTPASPTVSADATYTAFAGSVNPNYRFQSVDLTLTIKPKSGSTGGGPGTGGGEPSSGGGGGGGGEPQTPPQEPSPADAPARLGTGIPLTGDTVMLGLLITLAAGSAAGLCTALGFYLRRRGR